MIQPRYFEQRSRIPNPRAARTATHRRIVRKSRARYVGVARVSAVLFFALVLLMGYVVLTSSLTGLSYAVGHESAKREALQEETMRLDDRIEALRSDDRLAALAAKLGMREPQQLRRRETRAAARGPSKADVSGAVVAGRLLRAGRSRATVAAQDVMHERTFARVAPMRARLFFYACMVVALFLSWRLFDVQARNGAAYAKRALAQRSDTVEIFARRGSILDRAGNVLVRSLPSESIYAVPREVVDADTTVAKLSKIVGKLDPAVVSALHDRHMWFVWIARKVPHETARRIRSLGLLGINLKEEDTGLRVDSAQRLASTVLGFVGTDENGLDGVEYAYGNLLRGHSGRVTLEADEFGRPIPFGREQVVAPAQPGASVALTIDPYLQIRDRACARQTSQRVPRTRRHRDRHGSLDRRDTRDGESAEFRSESFLEVRHGGAPQSRRDGRIQPGSTYKLITAAAALESHKVTLASRFPAHDRLEVGGQTIHNAKRIHGGNGRKRNARANRGVLAQRRRRGSRSVYRREETLCDGTQSRLRRTQRPRFAGRKSPESCRRPRSGAALRWPRCRSAKAFR